jgi:fumarylacetoacetase
MTEPDHTHDVTARSWIATANAVGCDFPIQNLPFAVFRRAGNAEKFRGGVAIGDQIVDLDALPQLGRPTGLARDAVGACRQPQLNEFFAMGAPAWRALRHELFGLLHCDSEAAARHILQTCLVPQSQAEYALPARIGDYTDFYTSIYHAANIGRLFRPKDPLTANFRWMPIAYHGRASSIGVSGQQVHRPRGQVLLAGESAPKYAPCARLDYELELGIFIGTGNPRGKPIPVGEAEDHVFGLCLLNDWSARDIQAWESTPLGPFLAKNFATTISPWIVTLEALAPYREPWHRPAQEPQPLSYLEHPSNRSRGAIDIQLGAWLESARHRHENQPAQRLSRTSFRHQYWTVAQMVAHHTVGGCNLQCGDLLGSGTISGPTPEEAGALIELSEGGRRPLTLDNGEQRSFLEDGDAIIFKAWCEKPGFAPLGFGELRGQLVEPT